MASLYIAEFTTLGAPWGNVVQSGQTPPVTEQKLAIGVSSVQSAAFGSKTLIVRISTDAICSVAFGDNPTATSNNARMAANQTEYFAVVPGQKVAVITNT